MTYTTISLESDGDIGLLTFERPSRLNAMNRSMMDELLYALESLGGGRSIRVLVVAGRGSSFMAGADIKEYASQSDEAFAAFQRDGHHVYRLIEELSIPVVAAVQGYALGGGFEIALACDFLVAHPEAELGLPEVKLGLVPGGGGTQRLLEKIGQARSTQMLLLGDRYTARELHGWGIVSELSESPLTAAEAVAERLARRPAHALSALKQLIRLAARPGDYSARLDAEAARLSLLFKNPESQRRIEAFASRGKG